MENEYLTNLAKTAQSITLKHQDFF